MSLLDEEVQQRRRWRERNKSRINNRRQQTHPDNSCRTRQTETHGEQMEKTLESRGEQLRAAENSEWMKEEGEKGCLILETGIKSRVKRTKKQTQSKTGMTTKTKNFESERIFHSRFELIKDHDLFIFFPKFIFCLEMNSNKRGIVSDQKLLQSLGFPWSSTKGTKTMETVMF